MYNKTIESEKKQRVLRELKEQHGKPKKRATWKKMDKSKKARARESE